MVAQDILVVLVLVRTQVVLPESGAWSFAPGLCTFKATAPAVPHTTVLTAQAGTTVPTHPSGYAYATVQYSDYPPCLSFQETGRYLARGVHATSVMAHPAERGRYARPAGMGRVCPLARLELRRPALL